MSRLPAAIDPAALIERSRDASIVMDAEGAVRGWNAAAERIFGWTEAEAIGQRLSELIIPRRYRDLHERGLRTYLDHGIGPVLGTTIEIEGLHRRGHVVPVELSITPWQPDDDAAPVFHAFLRDVTDRRRLDRMLAAESAVGWLCADSGRDVSLDALLAAIGTAMHFEVGIAWMPAASRSGGEALRMAASWSPTDAAASFVLESQVMAFERGVGFPGTVWSDGVPLWSDDVGADSMFVRRASASRLGFHAGLFMPVGRGSACRGVLEFLSVERREPSADLVDRITELGARIEPFVSG